MTFVFWALVFAGSLGLSATVKIADSVIDSRGHSGGFAISLLVVLFVFSTALGIAGLIDAGSR